jgi:hypothetical protein
MEHHSANPSMIVFVVLIPLLAWRMYSRFKRMVGRQRLSSVRPWITIGIFPLLTLLIGAAALSHPERLGFLAAGLIAGSLLGVFGLGKTRFESTSEGLYYTPNAHLGLALSLVFVARIAFRFVQVYTAGLQAQQGNDFAHSPLTLCIFGLLAGYYVAYAIGLVRWRLRALAEKGRAQESVSATRSS